MELSEIIKALRRNMVETGSLICVGCGREHNCSIYGCTIMREAADALERLSTEKEDSDAHLKAINDCLSEQLRSAAAENKPLTLDQLRQMDGEPVWVKATDPNDQDTNYWAIVSADMRYAHKLGGAISKPTDGVAVVAIAYFEDYGNAWLAYARKPEGSEKSC